MKRIMRSLSSGFLFGLILCVVMVVLKGINEGWSNIRITNPPIPELVFYVVISMLQSCFAWTLLGQASNDHNDKFS